MTARRELGKSNVAGCGLDVVRNHFEHALTWRHGAAIANAWTPTVAPKNRPLRIERHFADVKLFGANVALGHCWRPLLAAVP